MLLQVRSSVNGGRNVAVLPNQFGFLYVHKQPDKQTHGPPVLVTRLILLVTAGYGYALAANWAQR